jgi:SAM-dependent methyltransferase
LADWSETGHAYAASFGRLTEGAVQPLLDAVAARADLREHLGLLDVGTGPGTVAASAAARGWRARGVDAEPSMVREARRRHPSLVFAEASLPDLPFEDGAFDLVTASFVINHVADPAAAIAELARVASPGGSVGVTIWPAGGSPLRPLWEAVLATSKVATYPADTQGAEATIDRSADGLCRLLSEAGLIDVGAAFPAWTFTIAPEDLWLGVAGGVASVGGIYRALDPPARRALRTAYDDEAARRVDRAGMLRFPHTAILAVGRRP